MLFLPVSSGANVFELEQYSSSCIEGKLINDFMFEDDKYQYLYRIPMLQYDKSDENEKVVQRRGRFESEIQYMDSRIARQALQQGEITEDKLILQLDDEGKFQERIVLDSVYKRLFDFLVQDFQKLKKDQQFLTSLRLLEEASHDKKFSSLIERLIKENEENLKKNEVSSNELGIRVKFNLSERN